MNVTNRQIAALAGAGSAGLLLAALMFQVAGYAPCHLCILQRWPHLAAAVIGAAIWFLPVPQRLFIWLGAIAAAVALGLALYHTGVEARWWAGPSDCSGSGNIANLSVQDLMAQIKAAPVVRCDEVAWSLFGVSMAGWNAIATSVLLCLWMVAGLRRR
ncbi:MAG: disulfide bond formation protein B [Paracoccus sp. (in: a-proteobacteria)]|uniref:disulfide bond formation protein B n=1 Tax=Paracoccus sp. TaxID=267 RepID=UPI0026E05CA4|nr:disulfide bond formation protein B [Paracoccus sp. (in: a-proteobacteria)]MDO5621287.1 disulfide bond formation protein B [Paracoccus sp. (in: a-proteobacteria)]